MALELCWLGACFQCSFANFYSVSLFPFELFVVMLTVEVLVATVTVEVFVVGGLVEGIGVGLTEGKQSPVK